MLRSASATVAADAVDGEPCVASRAREDRNPCRQALDPSYAA